MPSQVMPANPKLYRPPTFTTAEAQLYMKALFWGPGGHGKTTLIGTAQLDPRTSPLLLLDFEGNTESLVGIEPPIDIIRVRNWDDFSNAYHYLRRGDHPYRSVGIDSITEVNIWALMTELDRQAEGRDEPDQAQLQDYGKVLTQMRRLLKNFRDLPMHVFYTATDDSDTFPGEGTVRLPMMLGRMQKEVGTLLSVVAYTALEENKQTKQVTRTLLLHDVPRYRVKIREEWNKRGTIPAVLEDPTIGKLMDLVMPTSRVEEEASV